MTVLQFLNAIKGLTILDVISNENNTKFFLMATRDISFSDLCVIKEQLGASVKDIIVYTYESKNSPHEEQCQLEIIVNNLEK